MGTIVNEREPATATATADAPARPRRARQNVDEAIVVRWRDGIAIVELVSTVRRKHRRRTPAPPRLEAAPATPGSSTSEPQGAPSEESER